MKRYLLCIIVITTSCFIITSCQRNKPSKAGDQYTTFRIMHGTNIAHWLSQSDRRGEDREAFFTEKDIWFIDSCGFDHIRLPIDEVQMWDEAGKRDDEAFALLNNCMEWCRNAGLRAIVDLHILRSHYFDAKDKPLWTVPAEQDRLIALWRDLSVFLCEWPRGMVAYELMNEPVADDPEQWNSLLSRLVDSLRQWEPGRVLVIGSNRWQSATTFDQLKVPANDTNIILSFHFYEPFLLTHYQAPWNFLKDFTGDVNYPGQIVLNSDLPEHRRVYNRDTLVAMMQKPVRLADSLNLPLYCGEFGIYKNFFPAAKLAWYRDMISIFEEYGIAYANWNYKSESFGMVDEHMRQQTEIIRILLNAEDL